MPSPTWEEDFGLSAGESFIPDEIDETFDLSTPHVATMLGPVEPDALGLTLFLPSIVGVTGGTGIDEAAILEEIEAAYLIGLRTLVLVDTPPRDFEEQERWIAARCQVHLISMSDVPEPRTRPNWLGDRPGESLSADRSSASDSIIADITAMKNYPGAIHERVVAGIRVLAGTRGVDPSGASMPLTAALHRIPLALMDAGLSALDVRSVLIDNPAAVLTVAGRA